MPAPPHDFAASLELAKADPVLKRHLLGFLKTDALSAPDKSDLVSVTCDVMDWVIQHARRRYAIDPERLVGVISSASSARAYAIWSPPRHDWIVVTEGLMELLRDSVGTIAERFVQAFPEVMESELVGRLLARAPLRGGFNTSMESFMYIAAMAFFSGHEAAHHLAGHDGHYVDGVHAEQSDEPEDSDAEVRLKKQALERQADIIGLTLCTRATAALLGELQDTRAFSVPERRSYERALATLVGTGAMTAALRLVPKEIDWEELAEDEHPPHVVRLITLAASLPASLREAFPELDETSISWIRVMSLEVAAAATIQSWTPEGQVYQERTERGGEPAAIRATGIRKVFYDPRFDDYLAQLDAAYESVKPRLKPRM